MRRATIMTAAAGALAGALLLTACAPDPGPVPPAPALEAQAAVTEERAQVIIDATFDQLALADKNVAAADLAPRWAADALTVRTAQYTILGAVPEAGLPALPSAMQRVYVTGTETWPRVMAAVSEVPSETETPVVYLWVQENADEPYKVVAWAHMIPGATLPAMPGPADGAVQLTLDEAGVEPTPNEVLTTYLEYLRQGSGSELAASFAPDSYAAQLFAARESLTAAAATASGAYVDTIQPDLEHTYVVSTQDGGALIFAPVQIDSSFSVSGATLTVSGTDAPLQTGSVSTRATYVYRDFVVIAVPPPGQGALPAVVAAQHHLVSIKPE